MAVKEKKGGEGAGVTTGDPAERVASEKNGAFISAPNTGAGHFVRVDELVAGVDLGSVLFMYFYLPSKIVRMASA